MGTILLRGRHVVSDPAALPDGGIIDDGGVLVSGRTIEAVGSFGELSRAHPDAEVIGSGSHLVIPGLVNAHDHGRGLAGNRLGVRDGYLEPWLFEYWRQHPLDCYLDTLYSVIRQLRSGVTTVLHLGYTRDWARPGEEVRDSIKAYRDSGMRVAFAPGVEDQNAFIYDDNDRFIESLPGDLGARLRSALEGLSPPAGYDFFELMDETLEAAADEPNIQILYGPSGPEWVSPDLLARVSQAASAKGVGIHIHCLESPIQKEFFRRSFGKTAVAHLNDVGILGPKSSLGHGGWLNEDDMALCAETGTSVCHNPSSNLRLHNGIAPIARMLEMGTPVALGMDSNTLNSDHDMFQEMRLADALHRCPRDTPYHACPEPADILRMATLGGAKATTYGDRIGALVAGRDADAVFLDFDRISKPYLEAGTSVTDIVVRLARPEHVDKVMVSGRMMVDGGRYLHHDESAIAAELATIAAGPVSAQMQAFYDLFGELRPLAEQYYRKTYGPQELTPGYAVNSLT